MSHFVEICEYGHAHGQCRCIDNHKTIKYVKCDIPDHAEKYGPYSKDFVVESETAEVVENIRESLSDIESAFSTYTMTGNNFTNVYISTMRDVFNEVKKIREELNKL